MGHNWSGVCTGLLLGIAISGLYYHYQLGDRDSTIATATERERRVKAHNAHYSYSPKEGFEKRYYRSGGRSSSYAFPAPQCLHPPGAEDERCGPALTDAEILESIDQFVEQGAEIPKFGLGPVTFSDQLNYDFMNNPFAQCDKTHRACSRDERFELLKRSRDDAYSGSVCIRD